MNGPTGFLRASHRDCPNHSAFLSKAELDRLKANYHDLVARGAVIPPNIAALARRLGIA
jgi:hypothetical protein